jgi:hypothetical protein
VVAHRILRRGGSHIFLTILSNFEVRLLALHAGHPLPQSRYLGLNSIRVWVYQRARVSLEILAEGNPTSLTNRMESFFCVLFYLFLFSPHISII